MDQRQRALDEQLARDLLRSEKLRQTILAITLVCAAPFVYGMLQVGTGHRGAVATDVFQKLQVTVVGGVGILVAYALLARQFIIGRIKAQKPIKNRLRVLNSFIETSFVTAFIVAFSRVTDPIFAFTSPPTYLYLIFVMLSILQLHVGLSIFTGVASSVLFTVAAFIEYARVTEIPNPAILLSPTPLVIKGILFTMGGVVAGFVARQLRRRMVHAIEALEEKNRAIEMFGTHVSPKVAEALLKSGGDFAGEQKFVCVMFLDIRNFTSFSERTSPKDVVAFLDVLFEPLVTIVNRHGGIVNKFLGDGFMAVFGAPIAEGQPCREGILAALEIVKEVESMVSAGKIPPTKVGIGLHAGEAITGTVGARSRKEYTVIGDTVNLAARIEQLTKKFGVDVLVSDAVWNNAGPMDIQAEALEKTEVKGREAPVQVYKIA